MSEKIKINSLELENVKRIKAVRLEPTANGLTVVGGKNNQGKTSVLDAIAWALGGNKFKPSQPNREGSTLPPSLSIQLSNGLIVERKGKNSDLKVIDPNGNKAGQNLLNEFIDELALNLPKFMNSNNKEKANTLLQIIGVGDKLYELEKQENEIYNKRHAIGQIADRKAKYAEEQDYYPEIPNEFISASDLIKQQQEILARNDENQKKRENLRSITQLKHRAFDDAQRIESQIEELQQKFNEQKKLYEKYTKDEEIALKTVAQLKDESTAELEKSINEVEEINAKVRINLSKEKAEDDAKEYKDQYDSLTVEIETVRKAKKDLLNNAELPLKDLSVEDGELIYKGFKWDNMSGSDQLKVATAIVRKLNPNCGFVLIDKLEQMDLEQLNEFGKWLEKEGLQAIATRVSTGDECSIIIEDGYVAQDKNNIEIKKEWKAGEF